VERFWRSVKYKDVYLHAYDGVSETKKGLERYSMRYNQRMPRTAFDGKTTDEFYVRERARNCPRQRRHEAQYTAPL
jgi:putative transposase